jgi:hypothetical protein
MLAARTLFGKSKPKAISLMQFTCRGWHAKLLKCQGGVEFGVFEGNPVPHNLDADACDLTDEMKDYVVHNLLR